MTRPCNSWSDVHPSRRAEAEAAMCQGKDGLTPGRARKIARRMRHKRHVPVEAYRCLRCGEWHVGKPMGKI